MYLARRPLWRAFLIIFAAVMLAATAFAAEKPRVRVEHYDIDADIQPVAHKLTARATVRFTALEDINVASFELNNALRPTRVLDAEGHTLQAERVLQDNSIRIALPVGLTKGQTTTMTIEYEGVLQNANDSPVPGLKLAYIGEPSFLLYAGRWFPVVNYGFDRFTANISVSVPTGLEVIGSGATENPPARAPIVQAAAEPEPPAARRGKGKATEVPAPAQEIAFRRSPGSKTFHFAWTQPSFPGTIIAGKFETVTSNEVGAKVYVYFTPAKKAFAASYADFATKQFQFFSRLYGPSPTTTLRIIEIPDDTVPMAWAPEIVALASRAIQEKPNYRLLANSVARQWWGVKLSPANKNDFWLEDGFARYSEARYVEFAAGEAGFEEAMKDIAVGALAYDNVPLSSIARLDEFSPEFQLMSTDKGAMILHMLRYVMGDQKFDQAIKDYATQFAGKPVSLVDLRGVAEKYYGQPLTWFFAQWLDSTGAPEFKNHYTVMRTAKGFRVMGEIQQDLDLFRMPVELRVDTDGQTESKVIEVVGTNSPFSVDTFGKPRRISIDPANRVLKNSTELKVRSAIMRGQQLVQQGDLAEALKEFQKALDVSKNSSLAHYRIAEVFFLQRNYQAAANAYRESLNGDGEPRWTEVWSRIQLGKIFDLTGQRERAVNEYRQALQTNDNTQGALDEARKYLQSPYDRSTTTQQQGN